MTDTCENTKSISVRFLKKHGYLDTMSYSKGVITWKRCGFETGKINVEVDFNNTYMQLLYFVNGGYDRIEINVDLLTTSCHLGGHRYWFQCPAAGCGRRVGVLYEWGNYFACRYCTRLLYDCQVQNRQHKFYALGKAWALENELEEEYRNMRVKFWKGKPTKRYKRWLEKMAYYEQLAPHGINALEELDRCLNATK